MSTPAEQIEKFIKAHPGEWREVPTENPDEMAFVLDVYPYRIKVEAYLSAVWGSLEHVNHDDTPSLDPYPQDASLLTQIAWRGADAIQAHGGSADTLPPWLAGPVSHQLINRARTLLTFAGISPADTVMAAETVDEALCARPVVEVTGILPALMAIGMSCRWAMGADEAADDYVGFVSKRLDVVAGERDALAARLSAANGELLRLDGVVTPEIMGEVLWNLRRVLGVT